MCGGGGGVATVHPSQVASDSQSTKLNQKVILAFADISL